MEDESRFYVGFYCGFRSTQPTVDIESFYRTQVILLTSELAHKLLILMVNGNKKRNGTTTSGDTLTLICCSK